MKKQASNSSASITPSFLFKSNSETLMLPFPPQRIELNIGGETVVRHVTLVNVKFERHFYKTMKPEIAAVLRSAKKWCGEGKLYKEVTDEKEKLSDKTPPPGVIDTTVKTKNEAILLLVKDFGVKAEDLNDKDQNQLIEFAKESYNLVFKNWKPEGGAPPAGDGKQIEENEASSKNDAITILISKYKATPATFKKMNVGDIKAIALKEYNVVFPNWNPASIPQNS
jgi:hypothetical protein